MKHYDFIKISYIDTPFFFIYQCACSLRCFLFLKYHQQHVYESSSKRRASKFCAKKMCVYTAE